MNLQNPLLAIKAYCLGCMCGQRNEVKLCPVEKCELYPFRFGKNPYRKKTDLSEDRKAELAERMRAAREKRGES